MEKFTVKVLIPALPLQIYDAWLEGRKHTDMTGSKAEGYGKVGKPFTAWDGYISGTNIELIDGKKIVQLWRASEFAPDAPDSRVEIDLTRIKGGTVVTINHSKIPDGLAAEYKKRWVDYYFKPMTKYFENKMKARKAK